MAPLPVQSGGDDVSAIVVDPGFESIRIGNCQEDFPREYIPSVLYREFENPSSSKESWQILSRAKLREFSEIRKLLYINRENNLELDPFVFERLLHFGIEGHDIFVDAEDGKSVSKVGGLALDPTQHPILVVEPTAESKQFRDSSLEVLFEQLNVCAAYLAKRAALTAFSVGRSSALVVDIGAGGCTVSPVHEGISLQSTIQDSLVGGNSLDLQLCDFLFRQGYPLFGPTDDVRIDYLRLQTAKELRERFCSVKYAKEEPAAKPSDKGPAGSAENQPNHSSRDAGGSDASKQPYRYYLPDGTSVNMESYVHSIPELLFDPSPSTISEFTNFRGLVPMINDCVFESDVDIRRELTSSIVVAGGFTLTHGLINRLSQELLKSPIGLVSKIKLVHSSSYLEKRFSTWLGGSILASLGRFQQLWISRAEYQEHGTIIAYRRCH